MKIVLHEQGPSRKKVVVLDGAESYVLGRAEGALIVPDPSCSRSHAAFYLTPDGNLAIRDLNSTTGTFVNGAKITEAELFVGSQIKVGGTVFLVVDFVTSEGAAKNPAKAEKDEPTLSDVNKGVLDPQVLVGWPDNLRALPEKQLKQFVDHFDDTTKKKSMRLTALSRVKKKTG